MQLIDLTPGAVVRGVKPNWIVTIIGLQLHGSDVVILYYQDGGSGLHNRLLFAGSLRDLDPVHEGRRRRVFGRLRAFSGVPSGSHPPSARRLHQRDDCHA